MRHVLLIGILLGLLQADAEVKPPAGPWLKEGETLACYGDSITAGKYYFPLLKAELEKRGIKVVNAGLSGDKTPMALTRIKDVAAMEPDAVVFFFGANDSVIGRGRWRDEPTVSPVTYRDNLIWMIHYFRLRTKVRKFAIVAPPCCCEGDARSEYADVFREYRLAAREAADRADAVLVPLDVAFETARQRENADWGSLLMTRDGVHFSPKGSQCTVETMLRVWNLTSAAER